MVKQVVGLNVSDGTSENISMINFDNTLDIDLYNSAIGIENKGKLIMSNTAIVKIDMDALLNVDPDTNMSIGVVNYDKFVVEEGGNVVII